MDEPNETTEQVEETPSPEVAETATEESPPWGDDFDAERAWNTIKTLRSEVKETKQSAQEARELQEIIAVAQDPSHPQHREALQYLEFPYEVEDDEEYDLEDDPVESLKQEIEQLKQAQGSQQEAEDLRAFSSHLEELAGKAEIELSQRDQRYLLNASSEAGFTPEATEQVFEEWLEDRKAHDKSVVEQYLKTKQAPHVSKVGSQVTEDVLPLDATPQERHRWMTERFQMGQQ